MSNRAYDPARVFVRGGGLADGVEWGFWLVITVFWVIELGLGPFELVLMGTVLEASVLLGETPTGVVADLHSRKRSVVISQIVMGIGFIWAVASTNYWVILPAQAVFGIGWTFRSGADTAWVTDELRGMGRLSDDDHDELDHLLLHKHRVGIAIAMAMVVFTVVLGQLTTVRWAAVVMGLLQIGVGFYYVRAMHEDHFVPGKQEDRGFFDTLKAGLAAISTQPRLRVLVAVIVVLDLGSEAFDRLGYKHFLDNAGVDDDSLIVLGALFLGLSASGLLVNLASTRVLKRGYGVARLAVVLLALAAVGGYVASITSISVVIAFGFMTQDSTREALWPVLDAWANRDAPSEVRATVHSLMGQTTAIGELVGGMALGTIAEFTSIRFVLILAASLWVLSSLLATRGVVSRGDGGISLRR